MLLNFPADPNSGEAAGVQLKGEDVAVISGRTSLASETATLKVGDAAPDFEVPAHDGTTSRLGDLAGRKVLLWFYPKADTPG